MTADFRPGRLMDNRLVAEILDSVASGFAEQVQFTKEMIRCPSVRGHEQEAQAHFSEALSVRGYSVDQWSIDVEQIKDHPGFSPGVVDYENSVNLVGTHNPRNNLGRSLILNGHVDVVPTGPVDMWERPPFEPYIVGTGFTAVVAET